MSKPTEGPWQVTPSGLNVVTQWADPSKGWPNGLRICDTPSGQNPAVRKANARVLALAPDLLDALAGLLEACDSVAEHDGPSRWRESEREAARALIARARGE